MFRALVDLFRRYIISICVCSCAVVVLAVSANARAANCSITTTPSPAVITEGGSVSFAGAVSGKRPTSITSWSFPGRHAGHRQRKRVAGRR